MKKRLVLVLIIVLCAVAMLVGCQGTDTDMSGKAKIVLNFDKVYAGVEVGCPQGEIVKTSDTQYEISLTNKTLVDVVIYAEGYKTKTISVGIDNYTDDVYTTSIALEKKEYVVTTTVKGISTDKVNLSYSNNVVPNSVVKEDGKIITAFAESVDCEITFTADGYLENKAKISQDDFTFYNLTNEVYLLDENSNKMAISIYNDIPNTTVSANAYEFFYSEYRIGVNGLKKGETKTFIVGMDENVLLGVGYNGSDSHTFYSKLLFAVDNIQPTYITYAVSEFKEPQDMNLSTEEDRVKIRLVDSEGNVVKPEAMDYYGEEATIDSGLWDDEGYIENFKYENFGIVANKLMEQDSVFSGITLLKANDGAVHYQIPNNFLYFRKLATLDGDGYYKIDVPVKKMYKLRLKITGISNYDLNNMYMYAHSSSGISLQCRIDRNSPAGELYAMIETDKMIYGVFKAGVEIYAGNNSEYYSGEFTLMPENYASGEDIVLNVTYGRR